jgi:hypothetical protein
MHRYTLAALIVLVTSSPTAIAQTFEAVRDDQINRLRQYIVDAIQPSGLVRDSMVLNGSSFHPATPDAAGFALLGLSALDHVNKLPTAEQKVIDILQGYSGQKPGVNPLRSADGHFRHFIDLNTGGPAPCCWDASYSPISTALLVAGAQFAKNHFAGNPTIASLANGLTSSVNFNAAIHPSLDGRIFHDMTAGGGGNFGASMARPFDEYMMVVSLALREQNNARALAVKDLWLDPNNIPKATWAGIDTLSNSPGSFLPAFIVQQMHFFNGGFRLNPGMEAFFANHQAADKAYSSGPPLNQTFRYGLTAGVSPDGYQADAIQNHNDNVLSPEAVAAWGDMNSLMQFYTSQAFPANDPRYKYGMVRVSASQPSWVPSDAGLVDHTFLLFGLVESLDPDFFKDRVFGALLGDFNRDSAVNAADYADWRANYGSVTDRGADANLDGVIDAADYVVWRKLFGSGGSGAMASVPEAATLQLVMPLGFIALWSVMRRPDRRSKKVSVRRVERKLDTVYENACSPLKRGIRYAIAGAVGLIERVGSVGN